MVGLKYYISLCLHLDQNSLNVLHLNEDNLTFILNIFLSLISMFNPSPNPVKYLLNLSGISWFLSISTTITPALGPISSWLGCCHDGLQTGLSAEMWSARRCHAIYTPALNAIWSGHSHPGPAYSLYWNSSVELSTSFGLLDVPSKSQAMPSFSSHSTSSLTGILSLS